MAATFLLTLDTRAPQLQWGPVSDPNAGETLAVAYLADEPGVDRAAITLRDGRVLPMQVWPDQLRVDLPDDTTEGAATIRATTRDEVWNEATFELVVALTGVPYEPPAPYVPPTSGMPVVAPDVITTPPSACRTRSRYGTTAVVTSRSRVRVRARYNAPGFRSAISIRRRIHVQEGPSLLTATVSGTTPVRLADTDAITRVTKRPEGPNAEDELILLDLL